MRTETNLVSSAGATAEVTHSYSVADLDGAAGNEVVEFRTIMGTPARMLKIGQDPRGDVTAADEGPSFGGKTILGRDARGQITLVNGYDVSLDLFTVRHYSALAGRDAGPKLALMAEYFADRGWTGWILYQDGRVVRIQNGIIRTMIPAREQ